jgi:cellobiose-specific phosphotransferase system component IIB
VREYVGDTSKNGRTVEDWSAESWQQELREVDVMLFTPQILRAALERRNLPVSALDLLGMLISYCESLISELVCGV